MYNPLNKFYKSITGAIPSNKKVKFRVKSNLSQLYFVFYKDGETTQNFIKMQKENDFFSLSLSFDRGLYFYFFKGLDNLYISKSNFSFDAVISDKINEYQLSVYDNDFIAPSTINGGVIYQIFPDRFYKKDDSLLTYNKDRIYHKNLDDIPIFTPNENGKVLNNDFYGGNINGIIEKLDYLIDLGVNVIYLNPIFKSYSNHRYDTGDYFEIDELLGDKQDLINLINCCHNKGIKIILDGVFNHTGDDSLYFNKYNSYNSLGAYNSKNSPYYSWFNFKDYPNDYQSWWGITTLPTTNKNSTYVDFITSKEGVLSYYIGLGIDGFRLDVVDELPKDFVQKIRKSIKNTNKNSIIIGEVWEDASNKISYGVRREYFLGKELDSVMNYPLKNAIIEYVKTANSFVLKNTMDNLIDHYPKCVLDNLMNMLSTHDTPRIISSLSDVDYKNISKLNLSKIVLNEEQIGRLFNKLKIATVLQFTLPGVPSIYYGDEIGMQGFVDPLNRMYFKWEQVGNDFYKWYKKLIKIRNDYTIFSDALYEEIYSKNGAFVFKRTDNNEEILVAVNCGLKTINLSFNGKLNNLLDNKIYTDSIELLPYFVGIFIKD